MCKWALLRRCPEAERPFRCFVRNGDGHLTLSCVTPEETNQCIKCDSDSLNSHCHKLLEDHALSPA